MKARIEIPCERLMDLDVLELTQIAGMPPLHLEKLNDLFWSWPGSTATITVGGSDDFMKNIVTVCLDGDADVVRPVVTYLMDFLKGVT